MTAAITIDDIFSQLARIESDTKRLQQTVVPSASARVYNSAGISIATSGVSQALTFDSERFDNGSLHSTSANTSRLTAPITGLYLIGGNVSWDTASGTGSRYAQIRLNGTTIIEEVATAGSAAFSVGQAPKTLYQLAAGEYVELVVQQSSGGALSVLKNGNASPEFWMTLVAI